MQSSKQVITITEVRSTNNPLRKKKKRSTNNPRIPRWPSYMVYSCFWQDDRFFYQCSLLLEEQLHKKNKITWSKQREFKEEEWNQWKKWQRRCFRGTIHSQPILHLNDFEWLLRALNLTRQHFLRFCDVCDKNSTNRLSILKFWKQKHILKQLWQQQHNNKIEMHLCIDPALDIWPKDLNLSRNKFNHGIE